MIPVSEPLLGGSEKKYLAECIDSGWIGYAGPFVGKFEEAVAKYVGRKYAIAVSSGTAALHVALAALGIGAADEVIIPTFTYMACASAVLYLGAQPKFVDCYPDTFNMDVSQIEKQITRRTKAIMVAHIYGLPVDMGPVWALARKYDLPVVEDAAEVIGQSYDGDMCGSLGEISIFSFYGNKTVSCGEGGMVLTDNEELAAKVRSLAGMSQDKERRYLHHKVSWHYAMSNMQAAVGLAQLEQIGKILSRKRAIATYYNDALRGLDLQLPVDELPNARNCYWVYPVLSHKKTGQELIQGLAKRGVEARPFFWPLHRQPPMHFIAYGASHPVAEYAAEHGIYLPSGATLSCTDQAWVVKALKEIL